MSQQQDNSSLFTLVTLLPQNKTGFVPERAPPGLAWADQADALARWAEGRYVNRRDVAGGYTALEDRGREYRKPDGTVAKVGATLTRPAPSRRGGAYLTVARLERHFRARGPIDVLGLHTTSPENTSKFGTVELDHHGPLSNPAEVNFRAARAWWERLREMGFRPLLWDSNGSGGYHLDLLLAEPIATPRLYHFLRALVSDHAAHELPKPPECFPTQPSIAPGRYGNWVRLIGRHHTRDFWARVWGGSRWLEGAEAVAFVLALKGDPPSLVPEAPTPSLGVAARAGKAATPASPQRRPTPARLGENRSARAAAYLAKLPNLGEGQGRDDVAYNFAAFLVRDLGLCDEFALGWLERWDVNNTPRKGEGRLREIIASAHAYGRRPYGAGKIVTRN
jgi:hypothetical protein